MRYFPAVLGLVLGLASSVWAQDGPNAQPPEVQEIVSFLSPALKLDAVALAGLKKGTKVARLGLDSTLRLVVDRTKNPRAVVDTATFGAQSGVLTAAEFHTLRELLAKSRSTDPVAAFRDPLPLLMETARRQELLHWAILQQARRERIFALFEAYAKGGAATAVAHAAPREFQLVLETAKQEVVSRQAAYRDALDDLKTVLGLPYSFPIVIDDSLLAGFRGVFAQLEEWELRNGEANELDGIVKKLPRISDIAIGDRTVLKVAVADDERLEELIHFASARVGDPVAAQSVRKRLRRFATVSRSYELETNKLALLLLKCSTEIDMMSAPTTSLEVSKTSAIAKQTQSLNAARDQLFASEERLISWWVEAQILRFGLTRDLGLLPATWDDFVKDSVGFPQVKAEPKAK